MIELLPAGETRAALEALLKQLGAGTPLWKADLSAFPPMFARGLAAARREEDLCFLLREAAQALPEPKPPLPRFASAIAP